MVGNGDVVVGEETLVADKNRSAVNCGDDASPVEGFERGRFSDHDAGLGGVLDDGFNAEFGIAFAPLTGLDVVVDRTAQLAAIDCHQSQSVHNPVLFRRLALQGPFERVRLHRASTGSPALC